MVRRIALTRYEPMHSGRNASFQGRNRVQTGYGPGTEKRQSPAENRDRTGIEPGSKNGRDVDHSDVVFEGLTWRIATQPENRGRIGVGSGSKNQPKNAGRSRAKMRENRPQIAHKKHVKIEANSL